MHARRTRMSVAARCWAAWTENRKSSGWPWRSRTRFPAARRNVTNCGRKICCGRTPRRVDRAWTWWEFSTRIRTATPPFQRRREAAEFRECLRERRRYSLPEQGFDAREGWGHGVDRAEYCGRTLWRLKHLFSRLLRFRKKRSSVTAAI